MVPILAGACFVLFVALIVESSRRRALAKRVAELSAAAAAQSQELRIERFELLWFARVEYSDAERAVKKVAGGLPHCLQCVQPLKLEGKEWVCPKCGQRRPESVADIMVLDSVSKEALKQFLERHPDYHAP